MATNGGILDHPWVCGVLHNYSGHIFMAGSMEKALNNSLSLRSNPKAGHVAASERFLKGQSRTLSFVMQLLRLAAPRVLTSSIKTGIELELETVQLLFYNAYKNTWWEPSPDDVKVVGAKRWSYDLQTTDVVK